VQDEDEKGTAYVPKILLLPGDGIGPEVIDATVRVLDVVAAQCNLELTYERARVGGAAIDADGKPLSAAVLAQAKAADAVMLGAVGGPKWDDLPTAKRPERALLGLRRELGLYANIRPAKVFPALASASTLKEELVSGVDLVVVRELTGGIYFGEPRGVEGEAPERIGRNTLVYSEPEIERIALQAFELAAKRSGRVVSVDKANVLESTALWREVVNRVHANFPDIELSHMYVDNAAMQLIRNPRQFDVILTTNMFGDILSDAAAMLTGSIGMLASASLGDSTGMYEPVHGSAPDIAGQGSANPLATVLSAAMMLRISLSAPQAADAVESAVDTLLAKGARTRDLGGDLDTEAITQQLIAQLEASS